MSNHSSSPLLLHSRYGRLEVFASVGVTYDQQNRSLNTGLSPQCLDGGFFIFITLNKESFDPRHDYEDQLFPEIFVWVTRRGRSADHKDYVSIRQPETRVSLLARFEAPGKFVYLGELKYQTHREFTDPETEEVQQSYTWKLKTPIPEALLFELTLAKIEKVPRGPKVGPQPGRKRRPSNFDDYKRALSYAVGSLERTVVPGHHNYQVRLKKFLSTKAIVPEFERDFVDVYFTHLRFDSPPQMVMFLDAEPDSKRVQLATKFSIAVVAEIGGDYRLLNPTVAPELQSVFQRAL
jgi:Domain of unknown function (DUF3427)